MPLDTAIAARLAYVEAPLTFLADRSVKPESHNPPPGTGEIRRVGNFGKFPTRIHDARPIAPELSLDREGFVLTRHKTAMRDFLDGEEVKRVYYPEVEALVRRVTGAVEAKVFDHTIRVAERHVERGVRAPVQMVHNDYTEKSGPQRIRDLYPEDAAERLRRRTIEVNVWQPIRGPVEMMPLALADAQTIAPEDLVPTDLVYRDRVGEIYYGAASPRQRWYYFPRMTAEEAIVIKCFDSAKDGRARFSLHSAFADPTSPADASPRESIEIRLFAFFAG